MKVLRYNVSEPNIMTMVCCMNNEISLCANVGIRGQFVVPQSGFVSCFANDNENTYGNNIGSIDAEISAVSP